ELLSIRQSDGGVHGPLVPGLQRKVLGPVDVRSHCGQALDGQEKQGCENQSERTHVLSVREIPQSCHCQSTPRPSNALLPFLSTSIQDSKTNTIAVGHGYLHEWLMKFMTLLLFVVAWCSFSSVQAAEPRPVPAGKYLGVMHTCQEDGSLK